MANPKSKKRRKKIIFGGIVLVLVALTLLAVFKKKDAAVAIQQEKAVRRNLTELVKASGKIQPVLQVNISPEVSGEIVELPVKEGQKVKKGDLLVKIRPDNYVASRDSALANYRYALANSNTAAANMEKAQSDFIRNDALFQGKLISGADFQTAKTTLDVAKATLAGSAEQVAVAHASLQSAESDLSKTIIYSPIDGTVSKLNSELGERVVGTAMMAGTEIMTVSDLTEMEARVDIGEVDVVLISSGQKVRLEVDAFKDRKFNGVVTDIANSANNNNATSATATAASSSSTSTDATKFQVKIRIKEKETFLPGMSVSAEIETRYRTNVVTVPIQCVTMRLPKTPVATNQPAASATASNTMTVAADDPPATNEPPKQVDVVFVVEGDHVRAAPVKTGIEDDTYWEITDGVKEGEQVVTGSSKAIGKELDDGVKVSSGAVNAGSVAAK